MSEMNYGQYNAGPVTITGNVYFNVGGTLVTAAEATTEQLGRLAEAYRKEISLYGSRSFVAFATCVSVVLLSVPAASALLWMNGADPNMEGYKAVHLKLSVGLAVPFCALTFVMIGDWWREQRDILRVLKRERAVVRAQLGIRKRLETSPSLAMPARLPSVASVLTRTRSQEERGR